MVDGDSREMGFVQRRLPWVIAVVFFALYFLTLNPWVTSDSIGPVAKVTGWNWSPQISNPLLYIVTLPIRWVPASFQPIALNLLAALLGALALAQLARTVALLPHDRTRDQRQRERSDYSLLSVSSAWMPPLFACLICGLQLTFWEESTALTGEILSVFVFSYLVRCLLEYRLYQDDRWLFRFAIVYGVAIPCDWAFIGYLPVFVGAIIWMKGGAVFSPAFLGRMIGLSALGITTYALLPMLVGIMNPGAGGFIDLLKLTLGTQKAYLLGVPKTVFVLLSLTSLLPVMVMGIRFPSSIGDVSVVGAMLSNFMFRAMHLLFLGACVWVAFDPAFSPRNVASVLPISFVTFYYLGALAVGYFSGYVLLVFGKVSSHRRSRGRNTFLNIVVSGALWLTVVAAPLGLLFKNLPSIRLANGDQFSSFTELMVQNLPDEKILILTDEAFPALVVRSEFDRQGLDREYVMVDMSSLGIGYYVDLLRSQILHSWPGLFTEETLPKQLTVVSLLNVIGQVSQESPIYYLNSSFGLYFEVFYPRQRGLVTELVPYGEDDVSPPAWREDELEANQAFWTELDSRLTGVSLGLESLDAGSRVIGVLASREQNVWAVTLQQEGRLEEAKQGFERSQKWNPANTCVEVNLRQNEVLLSGSESASVGLTSNEMQLVQQNYGTYEQLLSMNGPIDESSFRLLLAAEFENGGNHRQAMLNCARAAELDSGNVQPKLMLANSYLLAGFPGEVIRQTAETRQQHSDLDQAVQSELVRFDALAHYLEGNRAKLAGDDEQQKKSFEIAEGLLKIALEADSKSESLLETLSQVYLFTDRYEEALGLFDRHLAINPLDPKVLQNKALAHIRLGQYGEAVTPLSQVLESDPANEFARINRAISYFREGDYANAKVDYEKVVEAVPSYHGSYFGLGRIAEEAGETDVAVAYFERYLELAPKDTDEYRDISARLATLKGQ